MSQEDFRSVRKESVSIAWSRRKEWMVGGGSGVGLIDRYCPELLVVPLMGLDNKQLPLLTQRPTS